MSRRQQEEEQLVREIAQKRSLIDRLRALLPVVAEEVKVATEVVAAEKAEIGPDAALARTSSWDDFEESKAESELLQRKIQEASAAAYRKQRELEKLRQKTRDETVRVECPACGSRAKLGRVRRHLERLQREAEEVGDQQSLAAVKVMVATIRHELPEGE